MQTKAISLTLLLLGLLSAVLTAPSSQDPATPNPSALDSVAEKETVIKPPSPLDRLQRFQQSCKDKAVIDNCLAYNQMVIAMQQLNIWNNETELTISKELSKKLSVQESADFCTNLTKTLTNLPLALQHKTLTPFSNTQHCVYSCYKSQNDAEPKDSCRVLYFGYKALVKSFAKDAIKADERQHQQPDAAVAAGDKQPSLQKGQHMKQPNGTMQSGKEESKSMPNVSNNTKNDGTIRDTAAAIENRDSMPAALNPEPSKNTEQEPAVGMGTNTQKKIDKQPAISPHLVPGVPEKTIIDGDTEQDGGDEGADLFDEEPKDPKGASQDRVEQYMENDSDESVGRSSAEVANDNVNKADANGVRPVPNEAVAEKPRPQDELAGMPRTSDIVQGEDPFYNQNDSNFFVYFLFAMLSCAILYVAYHNKSKLLALVVEGRRTSSGRGGFSKGRKHTAAYRKLDSNLEEAITSGSASGAHSSSQIIY